MKYSVDITEEAPSDWNDYLLKSKFGTIYNTKEYSFYAPFENLNPKFLRIIDNKGNVTLQTLLLEDKHQPVKLPKFIGKIVKELNVILKWSYGPVSESNESIVYFFNYLKKTKKRIYGSSHPLMELPQIGLKHEKWNTFLIELKKPKDELFANIDKRSGRKNIERAIERGVTVEEITDSSILEYFELYNNTKRERGEQETTEEQMTNFWKFLRPAGFSGFLARKDGWCIGGLLFSFFNKYINEWGVARSKMDNEEKLYSQDLIKWRIIEWGLDNKMDWYDLSGFNPNPISEKEEGIIRYKRKWGGKEMSQWIIKK